MSQWALEMHAAGTVRTFDLGGDLITVGRAAGATIALPASDPDASTLHAVLERQGTGWSVRDAGSAGGTRLNGVRLHDAQALAAGDELTLGSTLFRVHGPHSVSSAGPTQQPDAYIDRSEEWHAHEPDPVAGLPDRPDGLTPVVAAGKQAPPEAPVPGTLTRTERERVRVKGLARQVQVRHQDNAEVLAFRLDNYDGTGNRSDSIAVEFVGYRRGQVNEGEEVEVHGRWSRGTLRATEVVNLSTGSQVIGFRGATKAFGVVFLVLFVIVFVIVVGLIVGIIVSEV